MDWLYNIIENSDFPIFTAFLLGLAVALHPCPLATNIAAMGYIAKDVRNKRSVFMKGLLYTAGRMIAYSLLGAVLIAVFRSSKDMLALGDTFGEWGERLLAPVLIIIGLYFILSRFIHRHEHCPNVAAEGRRFSSLGGSFLLGVLLALTFCPESAIVYFGMLMPLSAKSPSGYLLPVVFSVATAVPTVLMAWAFAYGIHGTSAMRERLHAAERWINIVVGVLFISAGVFCMFF